MDRYFRRPVLAAIALFLAVAGGLSAEGSADGRAGTATDRPIRVGLMADFTGLPFLAAEREGLFAKAGVRVEFSVFRSAAERDTALRAGALDGCNADLIAVIFNRQAGYDIRIVAAALNRFSVVAGPRLLRKLELTKSPLTPDALAGAEIGISKNTVIEYVADTLMPDGINFRKIDVARIPIRLELLLQGQLDAAVLPLPFDALAVAGGGVIVRDSVSAGLDPDLFMFFAADLAERPEAYRALWRAVDQARLLIEADPDAFRPLLSARLGFGDDQAATMPFPSFPAYKPPALSEIVRAADWMAAAGLLTSPLKAEELVFAGLTP